MSAFWAAWTAKQVLKIPAKGQMKSKCIYEIIDFPKYQR